MLGSGWTRSRRARKIKVIPADFVKPPQPYDSDDERLFTMDYGFGLDNESSDEMTVSNGDTTRPSNDRVDINQTQTNSSMTGETQRSGSSSSMSATSMKISTSYSL